MSDNLIELLKIAADMPLSRIQDDEECADSLTRLCGRAAEALAAVTEERDRMREALKPFADAVDIFIAENHDAHRTIVTLGDFFHARAAYDGVTKPPR